MHKFVESQKNQSITCGSSPLEGFVFSEAQNGKLISYRVNGTGSRGRGGEVNRIEKVRPEREKEPPPLMLLSSYD
jgi:hypothetical protein